MTKFFENLENDPEIFLKNGCLKNLDRDRSSKLLLGGVECQWLINKGKAEYSLIIEEWRGKIRGGDWQVGDPNRINS